jgi:site-specific recombinase XerC
MPGRRHLRSPVPSSHPLLLEWWTDLEGDDRGLNTRLAYIRDLKDFAEYVEGRLEGASPEDLLRFVRRMTEAGLSVATRARRITALRQFYEWLRRRRGRPFSIAQDLHPPRRPRRVHRWWTEDQVIQFRAAFRGDSPRALRDRAMAELGLMGLRVSEVTRLDIERVVHLSDPERAALVVLRKGNKEQVLPITADARDALQAWIRVRPPAATPAAALPAQARPPSLRQRGKDLQAVRGGGARADPGRDRLSPSAPHGRSANGHGWLGHRRSPAAVGSRRPGDDPDLLRGDR